MDLMRRNTVGDAVRRAARLFRDRSALVFGDRDWSFNALDRAADRVAGHFASFGLNAPYNGTVVGAFLICALSIGASVFLIQELDAPLNGVIVISAEPMKNAQSHLGQ